MSLDLNELRELLAAIDQTDIAELTLKSSDFELTVRRDIRVDSAVQSSELAASRIPAPTPPLPLGNGSESAAKTTDPPTAYTQAVPPSAHDRRLVEVNSPMVGTFYRAPSPDESPFVELGDRIRRGQTICIIEAMKLMNELEAEVAGEVVEILLQNGEPVEYGQLLMRVNPD